MCGITTPWTLNSELSWNKTHRLGGMLFFVIDDGRCDFMSQFYIPLPCKETELSLPGGPIYSAHERVVAIDAE